MLACCDAAGVIYFQKELPKDLSMLPIARGPAKKLREFMSAKARHAYDGETLLVPGIPETFDGHSYDQSKGVDALVKFKKWIRASAENYGCTVGS